MTLSTRRSLAWSFVERYSSLAISIASTMVLARILTPKETGVYALCAAFVAIAAVLRDFGTSGFLIQEKDLTRDKIGAACGLAVVTAWSVAVLVFFSRHAIASFYGEVGVSKVLGVLSLNFLILPFASPTFALLIREMAFRQMFWVQVVSNTAQAAGTVLLAVNGHGYMSLAWGPVINVSVQTLMQFWIRPADTFVFPRLTGAGAVWRYGSIFVSTRLIESVTARAHEFIIAKQFDFGTLGLFSRANGLIDLFYANVMTAVVRVATPAFASDYRAGNPLATSFARSTAIVTCVAWTFFPFVALTARSIIHVLFGAQWEQAAGLASIMAVVTMPSYLVALAPNLLSATGDVKRRLRITLWFAPSHLIAVALATLLGLKALAAVGIVGGCINIGLYSYHLRQTLRASWRELFGPSLKSAAVAAICLVAMAPTLMVCRTLAFPALVELITVAVVGTATWLAAVRALSHPAYDECMVLLRHFLGRKPPR